MNPSISSEPAEKMRQAPDLPQHFLCGHSFDKGHSQGDFFICGDCGSFWDLRSVKRQQSQNPYEARYPIARGHYESNIGANKVATLKAWISKLHLSIPGNTVCEVGFGSGYTLKFLFDLEPKVLGIEAVKENVEFAVSNLGLPRERVHSSEVLPKVLREPVDLWLFLDSFEHILEIDKMLAWMKGNSAKNSKILIVCPRADSVSRYAMGKHWIHRIDDHCFHWSKEGLTTYMGKQGFLLKSDFYPLKKISLQTIFFHFFLMTGLRSDRLFNLVKYLPSISIQFNFGQMGLLFEMDSR